MRIQFMPPVSTMSVSQKSKPATQMRQPVQFAGEGDSLKLSELETAVARGTILALTHLTAGRLGAVPVEIKPSTDNSPIPIRPIPCPLFPNVPAPSEIPGFPDIPVGKNN